MKHFSIKVKFLVILISISVGGLLFFGYTSFEKYKEDKLAFVYGSMAAETESKKEILSKTIEEYDLLLTYMTSSLDLRSKQLPEDSINFLNKHKKIVGFYYHIPTDAKLNHVNLFELNSSEFKKLTWENLDKFPSGFTVVDQEDGLFVYKKELSLKGSYAVLYFNEPNLISLFRSTKTRLTMVFKNKKLITESANRANAVTLSQELENQTASFGLFETSFSGEKYFISYARAINHNLTFVNMIPQASVLLVQKVFVNQIGLVLCLIVSISLIVGSLAGRWLTWQLDDLTHAVGEVEKENFDIKVNVQSRDELGQLGMAFNSMTGKITNLLDELRMYNLELEQKVLERTMELQKLNNVQKAMLNSLGQGFVMIAQDSTISPTYSKIAEDMFEADIAASSMQQVLSIPEGDAQNFSELINLAFQGVMSAEDVTQLLPEQRTNSKDQKIFFNYAPIMNDEGALEYILIVGTDKTKELESIEKFNKEWAFSQMILKAVKNRFSLNKVLTESMQMVSTCSGVLDSNQIYPFRAIQRSIHTIKGSFSYFSISEITSLTHDFETYLESYLDVEYATKETKKVAYERLMEIEHAIEEYIHTYDDIIKFKEASTTKVLQIKDIEEFYQYLKPRNAAVAQIFIEKFSQTKVAPHFQIYPALVSDLAIRLNKKVNFVIEGGEEWLPENDWSSVFQEFIHSVRNTMDHGIETPAERVAKGKPETGTIKFSFKKSQDTLSVVIADDGRGIDWRKIAAKDSSITSEAEALNRIMLGGISSKDEVSDLSGRGVGVSALFSAVLKRGGKFRFENKINVGLKIHMEMPLRPSKPTEIEFKNVA